MSPNEPVHADSGPGDGTTTAPAEAAAIGAGDGAEEQAGEGDVVRDLQLENVRLRRILADRDLEIEMLRELSRGTY
jgi:hypothetical protein